MACLHFWAGIDVNELDPWDYFAMARRTQRPDPTSNKKMKWSKGSGGIWHYCELSNTYIKVLETSYYGAWLDSEGWAHDVIWFLSELKWLPDGTVWEYWDWDYV